MPEFTVREMEEADVPGVRALLKETWHDTYDGSMGYARVEEITEAWHCADRLLEELRRDDCHAFVAEDTDGNPAGHALAVLPEDAEDARLSRLYVRPGLQGHGIGGQLLQAALTAVPRAVTLSLEVEDSNAAAQEFYRKHGFADAGIQNSCGDQDNVPTLVMVRQLETQAAG